MKKITLLFAFLITSLGFSQEVLQDFENGGLGGPFGDAAAVIADDPASGGTRGKVAMLTSNTAGTVWQGINIALSKNVQLTSDKSMSMDVYSLEAITIAPKVVSGVSGAPDSTTSASHTGTGWETLTFTFDQGFDNTTTANGEYGAFVIYYNWDSGTSTFISSPTDRVFYVDNISGIGVDPPAGPTAPTTTASVPPARNDWDVISLFSDTYTPTAVTNFDAGWCGSGSVEEVDVAGNKILLWKSNPCQGIEFTSIDASAFTHMHVDLFIADGTDITDKVWNLKFVDTADNDVLEVNFNDASNPALEAGTWISIDVQVDLSNFDKLNQFGITSANLNNLAWYDNLYFYRAATASVNNNDLLGFSMYPNPAVNRLNISAKETIQNADIFNVLGKKVMSLDINKTSESIDVSNLTSGIYLVKYNVNGTTGTAKFVKQ